MGAAEMEGGGDACRSSRRRRRNTNMNINGVLNNFASSASMHGVPRIINARSVPAKVFWSTVCIGAFLTFVWTGANLLNQYYSYPKKVNVEIVQRPIPFPAVTVCNTDHLNLQVVDRLEKVFENETGYDDDDDAGEFVNRYQNYSTMTWLLLQANQQDGISSGSMQDSLEVLSRLGFVANVGPELSSTAGIGAEDFVVNCRFMDEDCNVTETFVKVFDPYYFNCFTFEPDRILRSKSTRLSGVEYGLSLLLFVGCAGHIEKKDSTAGEPTLAIPGMTESNPALVTGQGARVVVHSPKTLPLPTADGFDVPSGYSISIGLRARENIRIGPPHGNCTQRDGSAEMGEAADGDGGGRGGGGGGGEDGTRYTYTLVSCQNECIQKAIVRTCGCVDNRIPTLYPEEETGSGSSSSSLPYCLQFIPIPDACIWEPGDDEEGLGEGEEEGGGGGEAAGDSPPPKPNRCGELKRQSAERFRRRLDCRKQVYENMTIRDPDAMDRCGCHPPCRDVSYETTNSLSMLPDSQRGHAFYLIVDDYVDKLPPARKRILKKRYGPKYAENVKKLTVRVNVHIADSNIIKTTESPDYDLIRLVSDIGGQLGLWIGISVITLIEVLQLCADVFRIIVYQGRRLRGDWKQELPKGKRHQQQQQQQQTTTTTPTTTPSKPAKDGEGSLMTAASFDAEGTPIRYHQQRYHQHQHQYHQPVHQQQQQQHHHHHQQPQQYRIYAPLIADALENDEATFEINKMTSV